MEKMPPKMSTKNLSKLSLQTQIAQKLLQATAISMNNLSINCFERGRIHTFWNSLPFFSITIDTNKEIFV